jgi:formylglycine-generating enzyme required for sulfatase activity
MKFVPVPGTDVLFCIHETRIQDYGPFGTETPGVNPSWKKPTIDGFTVTDRVGEHPAWGVSWEEAHAYCAWLSAKEGRTYRLPTDREWSFAVGIGQQEKWGADTTPATVNKVPDRFPWGTTWPPPARAGNYSDQSTKAKAPRAGREYLETDDTFPTTAPVMSFPPNALGLFDLGGNVSEWCEDWWDATRQKHVLRGCSWGDDSRSGLLSSWRAAASPPPPPWRPASPPAQRAPRPSRSGSLPWTWLGSGSSSPRPASSPSAPTPTTVSSPR